MSVLSGGDESTGRTEVVFLTDLVGTNRSWGVGYLSFFLVSFGECIAVPCVSESQRIRFGRMIS